MTEEQIKRLEVNGRYLLKRDIWNDIFEVTILEVTPKLNVLIEYRNGNHQWFDVDSFRYKFEILEKLWPHEPRHKGEI